MSDWSADLGICTLGIRNDDGTYVGYLGSEEIYSGNDYGAVAGRLMAEVRNRLIYACREIHRIRL